MGQDRKSPRENPKLREKAEARLQSKTPGVQDLSHDEISVLVHELQVHQIELEMQNDELRRGQISLEEANRKYSDFYDFAPVGFLTLDESGIIREVNLTAASQLGVTGATWPISPSDSILKLKIGTASASISSGFSRNRGHSPVR